MKKIVSVLTSLVITCTALLGVIPVNAEETQVQTQPQPTVSNDISVEGTNSFGNMLSEALDAEAAELEENDGCNVFSAEVTGNEVKVSFETNEPCTLLAAIYDEVGVQMLASGTAEVAPEETEKTVTIETESMPQYFYLKVFLVDTYTLKPICTAYESPNYTKEMQEFFALTVNDFDEELVLNLDEDEDNNFAVFSEETIFLESDGVTNLVTTCDYENDYYVIENADSTLCSLSAGDTLSLSQADGSLVIVQIADITVNGTSVSITGTNAEMEDIFDIVKIDASQDVGEAIVDDSELE